MCSFQPFPNRMPCQDTGWTKKQLPRLRQVWWIPISLRLVEYKLDTYEIRLGHISYTVYLYMYIYTYRRIHIIYIVSDWPVFLVGRELTLIRGIVCFIIRRGFSTWMFLLPILGNPPVVGQTPKFVHEISLKTKRFQWNLIHRNHRKETNLRKYHLWGKQQCYC